MSQFWKFFDGLPTAAANPLAFIAYVALIGSWLTIAWKVQRNKQLLKHLDKLPEKDRLQALQLEMGGGVRLRAGLNAEQWIRSRTQVYLVVGFVVVCISIIMIVGIVAVTGPERGPKVATADVSLRAVPEPPADQRPRRDDLNVSYSSERKDGTLQIGYHIPYLDALRAGGPVMGVEGVAPYFIWGFPELSVKVTNNTPRAIVIVEVQVKVKSSSVDRIPVPVFRSGTSRSLNIVNEGWGDIVDPALSLDVTSVESCTGDGPGGEPPSRMTRKTFSSSDVIPIVDLVPSSLRDADEVCVFGALTYGTGARQTVRFATRVRTRVAFGAGMPATGSYRLPLLAGKAGYTAVLPVDQQVASGATDHFVVALAGDKSGHFDLELSLRTTGGEVDLDSRIALDLFVPRSDGVRLARVAEPVSQRTPP